MPTADGSTFTLDDQEIGSGVGVVGKKRAKRAVAVYRSGDSADCLEELLATGPTTEFDVEIESVRV